MAFSGWSGRVSSATRPSGRDRPTSANTGWMLRSVYASHGTISESPPATAGAWHSDLGGRRDTAQPCATGVGVQDPSGPDDQGGDGHCHRGARCAARSGVDAQLSPCGRSDRGGAAGLGDQLQLVVVERVSVHVLRVRAEQATARCRAKGLVRSTIVSVDQPLCLVLAVPPSQRALVRLSPLAESEAWLRAAHVVLPLRLRHSQTDSAKGKTQS